MINIHLIRTMAWANEDQSLVLLCADTDTGQGESIMTPYSEESIIWEAVKAFPVDQIEPFVPVQSEEVIEASEATIPVDQLASA